MATQTKRATIYFDPNLHKALRLKAVETSRSVSELVNEAVREALAEDADDLLAFEERADEALISYDELAVWVVKVGRRKDIYRWRGQTSGADGKYLAGFLIKGRASSQLIRPAAHFHGLRQYELGGKRNEVRMDYIYYSS